MATQDIHNELDILSNLPESLLCSNILPRLPLADAVRSSLLGRKWRYLWTKIPHLHFSFDFFKHMPFAVGRRPLFRHDSGGVRIKETMEQILIQHDAPLESFQFRFPMSISIDEVDIRQCIHHAAQKGVKQIALEAETTYLERKMHLPSTFFACTALEDLELVSFMIPEIPTLSQNFSFLRTCCLSDIGNLTDHNLQRLVGLCPLLQELMLINCEELTDLKIQALNLNYFILVGCTCVESLTADCPQLLQLEIRDRSRLAKLQIDSSSLVELKLTDCYKLTKLQLNSCVFLKEAGSLEALSTEGHSNVESLRKLSLKRCSSAVSGLPCSVLYGTFPDLEELQVSSCMMGMALVREREQEQAACEMEMLSQFTFPNLKNAYLDISSDMSGREVAVLGLLLKNAPSLKTLTVSMPYCPEGIDDQEFKIQLLGLKGASPEVEIIWEKDDEGDVEEYYEGVYDDERRLENESIERGWENEEQDYPPYNIEEEHDCEYSPRVNNLVNRCCDIL